MKTITVTTRCAGTHRWPKAPKVVNFLRSKHRHEFHWIVEIEVFHDDRELEFFILKHYVNGHIPFGDLGSQSCEILASNLLYRIQKDYGKERYVKVTVLEDGENGSSVTA